MWMANGQDTWKFLQPLVLYLYYLDKLSIKYIKLINIIVFLMLYIQCCSTCRVPTKWGHCDLNAADRNWHCSILFTSLCWHKYVLCTVFDYNIVCCVLESIETFFKDNVDLTIICSTMLTVPNVFMSALQLIFFNLE